MIITTQSRLVRRRTVSSTYLKSILKRGPKSVASAINQFFQNLKIFSFINQGLLNKKNYRHQPRYGWAKIDQNKEI